MGLVYFSLAISIVLAQQKDATTRGLNGSLTTLNDSNVFYRKRNDWCVAAIGNRRKHRLRSKIASCPYTSQTDDKRSCNGMPRFDSYVYDDAVIQSGRVCFHGLLGKISADLRLQVKNDTHTIWDVPTRMYTNNCTWEVCLPDDIPPTPVHRDTEGYTLQLQVGKKYTDRALRVMFGDVYFCGGQSNMQHVLSTQLNLSDYEIFERSPHNFRYLFMCRSQWSAPHDVVHLKDFPALCALSAWMEQEAMPVKKYVGLISLSEGGLSIKTFIGQGVCNDTDAREIHAYFSGSCKDMAQLKEEVHYNVKHYFLGSTGMFYPAMQYLAQNIRFIRVLWYQGEADSRNNRHYHCWLNVLLSLFEKGQPSLKYILFMIHSWRTDELGMRGWLRLAQLRGHHDTRRLSEGVLIPTHDYSCESIHPDSKFELARRAAYALLYLRGHRTEAMMARWKSPWVSRVRYFASDRGIMVMLTVSDVFDGLKYIPIEGCVDCCNKTPALFSLCGTRCINASAIMWHSIGKDTYRLRVLFLRPPHRIKKTIPLILRYAFLDMIDCSISSGFGVAMIPFQIPLDVNRPCDPQFNNPMITGTNQDIDCVLSSETTAYVRESGKALSPHCLKDRDGNPGFHHKHKKGHDTEHGHHKGHARHHHHHHDHEPQEQGWQSELP